MPGAHIWATVHFMRKNPHSTHGPTFMSFTSPAVGTYGTSRQSPRMPPLLPKRSRGSRPFNPVESRRQTIGRECALNAIGILGAYMLQNASGITIGMGLELVYIQLFQNVPRFWETTLVRSSDQLLEKVFCLKKSRTWVIRVFRSFLNAFNLVIQKYVFFGGRSKIGITSPVHPWSWPYSNSKSIFEVKQGDTVLVLGWVTANLHK